ncbi:MAG TPA: glycosyltransferase family 2 protein [bacterium]|nr:glycosyltransferase family 2 protein [bacterium]
MDKKEPLVSVVMPAYNAEKFIGEAIESILNQTFKDFEFIILDDCSTDKTWEIIQEHAKKDERIISVKNEKNLNIALNRNKGVEMSKGRYIVWADADDISKPERIEKLFNYMESHPDVGICGSNFQSFYGSKLSDVRDFLEDDKSLRENIFKFSPVAQPTAIIGKECFDKVGLYNASYPPAEDIDFSFRLGEYYKFANIPEILLMYREHPDSATHTRLRKQISSTLNVRARYFKNKSYNAGMLDYVAFGVTWLFQFLPFEFVIRSFKLFRRILIFLLRR